MTDQLELKLREAFAARAADVGPDTVARLSRVAYRPRTSRVPAPAAAGAIGGTAVAAAAAIWLVGLGTGTSNAFAGWTPSPTTGSSAQSARARALCAAQMVARATSAKPVLTDVRGPFTVTLFSDRGTEATCVSGPSFTSVSGAKMTSGYTYGGPGGIEVGGGHLTTRDGHEYTLLEGRAADDVKTATLVLDDGSQIKATVANGWFAAWWPSSHDAVRAELGTPTGTRIQTLSTGGPGCTGPGRCTRSAAGGGPAAGLHVGP
jgi:hypothetical protein